MLLFIVVSLALVAAGLCSYLVVLSRRAAGRPDPARDLVRAGQEPARSGADAFSRAQGNSAWTAHGDI